MNPQFIITSGATRSRLDATRYLSATSSGQLGALITQESLSRGARVTLIHGRSSALPTVPEGIPQEHLHTVEVETVEDLIQSIEVEQSHRTPHVVIHAMAVLDYVIAEPLSRKVPSGKKEWIVRLTPAPKAARSFRRPGGENPFLVTFKLESDASEETLLDRARASLQGYGSDLVVANELGSVRTGQHQAYILDREGNVLKKPRGKEAIASQLLDVIEKSIPEVMKAKEALR